MYVLSFFLVFLVLILIYFKENEVFLVYLINLSSMMCLMVVWNMVFSIFSCVFVLVVFFEMVSFFFKRCISVYNM